MKKLAIVTTHPIQYNAPFFRKLAQNEHICLRVFYTQKQEDTQYDKGFGQKVSWDLPLLEGYNYEFCSTDSKTNLKKTIHSIASYDPDAVLIYGWKPSGHLAIMRYFHKKKPVWFRGDSTLLNEKIGWKKLARRIFLTWVYSFVDLAFFVGTENKKYFEAHGLKRSKLKYAPHAIENERFLDDSTRDYENKAKLLRIELKINPDDVVVLYAGKFEKVKNISHLVKTFLAGKRESRFKKNVKLVLVGSGELESKLKDLAKNNDDIIFLGFQNQQKMPVIYRIGNIFCLPSASETWGLAINEAFICDRGAIVSSSVGCHPDLIENGVTGYVFTPNNKEELITSIQKATERYLEINQNVKSKIKDFNYETFITEINKQFQE